MNNCNCKSNCLSKVSSPTYRNYCTPSPSNLQHHSADNLRVFKVFLFSIYVPWDSTPCKLAIGSVLLTQKEILASVIKSWSWKPLQVHLNCFDLSGFCPLVCVKPCGCDRDQSCVCVWVCGGRWAGCRNHNMVEWTFATHRMKRSDSAMYGLRKLPTCKPVPTHTLLSKQ